MHHCHCSITGDINYHVGYGGGVLGGPVFGTLSSTHTHRGNYIYDNHRYYPDPVFNRCGILWHGIPSEFIGSQSKIKGAVKNG